MFRAYSPITATAFSRNSRTEEWKYIHYTDLQGMDELYHLQSDPYELQNLMGEASARTTLDSLQRELQRLLQS